MKVGTVIPRKASKFSQGSVNRPLSERHKAFLTIKPIGWNKEDDTQIKLKAPSAKQGISAGFDKYLFQLDGNEPPEKFILWCRDIDDKLVGSGKPNWDLVFDSLIDLTHDQANAVIWLAGDDLLGNLQLTYGEYGPFRNLATQKKILATSTKADGSMMDTVDGQAAWDRRIRKPAEINPLILEEIIFRLEELIYGTDMIGCNVFYLLRRLIHDYKVDPHRGIKEWQWRMTQLNV